ncbi:MAG: enoyl-CoA hydratase/isomerase family protein [Beijerinckiaceae bacterium]
MSDVWKTIREWPELVLERLEDAGVARITLNRPDKRNCWNREMCEAFLASLEIIRADKSLKCCITRGAGKVFSSGLDLKFLREVSNGPLLDWDRPTPTIQIANALRGFPRIMIAQIHGYCLGGAFGIMNCHDLVYAADDVQIGMPEILRGSFGQLVTSTLLHGGLPVKKLSHIALVGRNFTGKEADEMGIVSQAVPAAELEAFTLQIAREIALRHLAPLEHHKITVQLGRDLGIAQAIQVDQLVGSRLRHAMDPLGDVENYLDSQKGGPNLEYKRPDV